MNDDFSQAFAGRSIFLTGHTGFKGSWLAIWLHRLGARVTGYALAPPTEPSNFVASAVGALLVAHHEADLREAPRLFSALEAAQPEVVFHMAAQPIVREGYAQPRETFDVNVMGTVGLLEAVRALDRPCVVVVITSDKCYENREQVGGYREVDALGGHDPYSASKAAAEIVTAAYRRSFFFAPATLDRPRIRVASARAGNVIGGGDWAKDRIITDLVRHLRASKPIPVRSPLAVRPWQHVLEPLSGYLLLAARMLGSDDPGLCDAWNFGPLPGEDVSVCRLVEHFIQAWGVGSWKDVSDPNQPHEQGVLRLNVEKAIHRLGWRPRWSLGEAVCATARWYRRFYDAPGENMLEACLADIRQYEGSSFAAGHVDSVSLGAAS
jgi:CDP-glucose 4,6-dehydratase